MDWLQTLYFFFSPRLALRDILCCGSFSHLVKIMPKTSNRVVGKNGKQPNCFFTFSLVSPSSRFLTSPLLNVSRNLAKLGNKKMPVKLREIKITAYNFKGRLK